MWLTVLAVAAVVAFLYSLHVIAEGSPYPPPTYPNRTTYPEAQQVEAGEEWPQLEEANPQG